MNEFEANGMSRGADMEDFLGISLEGVVTLSEISQIWSIDREAKSLKSLASVFAVVGNFRSI